MDLAVATTLSTLKTHGDRAQGAGSTVSADGVGGLSPDRRRGWQRVLSSVATTEGTEETMMIPLIEAYGGDDSIREYLESHKRDELLHHELLKGYLKATFGFEKKARTLSDKVIYDRAFPLVSKLFLKKPLYGLAMLYFIECFGVGFYKAFKDAAERDGLASLSALIRRIEKDELRHMAGLEALIADHRLRRGGISRGDKLAIRACMGLMSLDVSMEPWALHNREVREHALLIGLCPKALGQGSTDAAARVMKALEGPC